MALGNLGCKVKITMPPKLEINLKERADETLALFKTSWCCPVRKKGEKT